MTESPHQIIKDFSQVDSSHSIGSFVVAVIQLLRVTLMYVDSQACKYGKYGKYVTSMASMASMSQACLKHVTSM